MSIQGDASDDADARSASAEAVANRLATVELRLRQLEVPPKVEPASDLGALRPDADDPSESGHLAATDVPPARPSGDLDERTAERLRVLSELVERQRTRAANAERDLQDATATMHAALLVERTRTQRLEAALARTYGQAQAVQDVVGALQSSRSYRLGHRLARLVGRSGPVVTSYATPIAPDVDPADVALVLGSGLFDPDWYVATYPDVVGAGVDPLSHFMTQARGEHRCPGPLFDTGWYVNSYGDELPEGRNPLAYYLSTGWRLGQRPWESFDPEDYVRIHPEIRGLDICPLVHRAAIAADGES